MEDLAECLEGGGWKKAKQEHAFASEKINMLWYLHTSTASYSESQPCRPATLSRTGQ